MIEEDVAEVSAEEIDCDETAESPMGFICSAVVIRVASMSGCSMVVCWQLAIAGFAGVNLALANLKLTGADTVAVLALEFVCKLLMLLWLIKNEEKLLQ